MQSVVMFLVNFLQEIGLPNLKLWNLLLEATGGVVDPRHNP